MSTTPLRSAILAAVSITTLELLPAAAHADALGCQQTINKELGKFTRIKAAVLRTCKQGAVKRGVPASPVECPQQAQDDRINAAEQKMKNKIAASCGGQNRLCNVADVGADADVPLADIGWDIGACPDLRGQGCTNPINDCNDIGTCVACIGHEAVNRANELYYDLLVPDEFATGSAVNACQIAIGKATTTFLRTKAKLLQTCWGKVLAGTPGFVSPCPDTDAATLDKLAVAEQKKIDAICKACGAGGDEDKNNLCDLPPGFSPAAIGFEPDCPDDTVPSSGMPCGAVVDSLGALIACVDCVTEFEIDCTTDLAVPALTSYPAECNPAP
jgi:hypothetical protein